MCTPQGIIDKLGGLAIDEAIKQGKYVLHYAKNIKNLQDEMRKLDGRRECIHIQVCEAIDGGKEIMPDVKTWQAEVDRLENDVDQLMGESSVKGNMHCTACSCPNIKWRYRLSKQAEKKIQDVKELIEKGHFEEIAHRKPPPPELEALSNENYVHFDSRRPIFNKIVHALEESSVNMIGVYGLGGVGKTTLALEVAEKMRRDGTFKQVSRATIPKGLTVEEIQSQLADGLNFKFDPNTDKMGSRAIQLWNKLTNGEKYLIILDDIWEKLDIKAIGIPITDVNKKCKVLLTSRDKDLLVIKMKADSFGIAELPEAEAWDLFKKKVGNFFESDPEINSIAHVVCKRCRGLPVAIIAIGAALEDKPVFAWKDALIKLERYELVEIEGIDPSVWASLRLSYDLLSPNAKSCFLLCSLFREDADIPIGDLTRHCLARRLLSRNPRTLEEVRNSVCTVIDALKSASLLSDGNRKNCVRIHDIIRDVGISIAREEKAFYVEHGALHWPENPIDGPPYSAISLIAGKIEVLPTKLTCPKLHTLMFENSKLLDLEVPDEFFSKVTQLSVLILTGMRMQQLPSSFGKLTKLRMLFLNECHLADISLLGDLNKELEVLRVRGSIIKALPPMSGQLTRLRVLDLEECKLKYLFSPTTARGLVHLEQLQVSSCEIMEGIVGFEGDVNEHVGEVKFVKLKQLKLENLPNLISFYAKKEKTRTTMESSSTYAQPLFNEKVIFPLLEKLRLHRVGYITEIWDKQSIAVLKEQGSFCQLMDVKVSNCAQLTHVFPFKMHALLKNLKELAVRKCGTMEGILEFEGETDEDGLNNEVCFSKLSTLKLWYLPNLVSFCTTNGNATILEQPLFNEKEVFWVDKTASGESGRSSGVLSGGSFSPRWAILGRQFASEFQPVFADSFVPFKRSKRTDHRFGVVRYANRDAADIAIVRLTVFGLRTKVSLLNLQEANEQDRSTTIFDSTKIIPEEIESKKDASEKRRRRRLFSDILNNDARDYLDVGLACSPSDSTHSSSDIHDASISTEDITRRIALIVVEIEDLVLAGKRCGLHFHENDGGALRKLMQMELEDQRLQIHNLIKL
ncbi:hypothetical protein Vadar_022774 [Vaccinium darrowii]|uniref:Uncharacterized protein n=1 Tax=Vaccinium darrowii TaxID=229202 RepID=A0ACB7YQ23_9ERIC|nr:hypothetical protein Vadar_022774 [Vaccinium darrowii]